MWKTLEKSVEKDESPPSRAISRLGGLPGAGRLSPRTTRITCALLGHKLAYARTVFRTAAKSTSETGARQ